jgi:hypothetical protein
LKRITAFLAVVALVLVASRASAECPAVVESWTHECAASGLDLKLRACRSDGFVVDVDLPDDDRLAVDISRARPEAFRLVGNVSVAPVGEFADWGREPLARQRALDAVTACVRRDEPPMQRLPSSPENTETGTPMRTMPLLLLALAGGALARALAARRGRAFFPGQLRLPVPGVLVAALSAATFGIRRLVLPCAFFHQNGQGPGWVDIGWRGVQSAYGPGYAEVYHWIAAQRPEAPEGAVFVANALAGATIPALAYVLVRLATSSRLVSGAAAVAIAFAPIGARLSQSESFYLPISWLLFIATLALADAARFQVRSAQFAADAAIAVLAISQAARIHPVAWVPAAVTPLVMATTAPDLRAAIRRIAASTALLAVGVSTLAGHEMWQVLHGSLGASWGPPAGHAARAGLAGSLAFLAIGAGVLAVAGKRATTWGLVPLALLAVVLAVARKTDLVGGVTPAIGGAYASLYAAPVVAMVASGAPRWLSLVLAGRERPRWATAFALATTGLLLTLLSAPTTTLPTDAREQSWVLGWRHSLPKNAVVYLFGHAGKRMLDVPLYVGAPMPRAIRLEDSGAAAAPVGAYYLRTSLCATDEGRAACDRFEGRHRLVPVERQLLPAIASLPSLPFTVSSVEDVLYRVEDTPSAETSRSPSPQPGADSAPP